MLSNPDRHTIENFTDRTKIAYVNFSDEVDRQLRLRGADDFIDKSTTGLTEDDILLVVSHKKVDDVLDGHFRTDQHLILKFKNVFGRRYKNLEIIKDLLISILPDSISMMRRDINDFLDNINPYTKRKNVWGDIQNATDVPKCTLHQQLKGYNNPSKEVIYRMSAILRPETVSALLKDYHNVELDPNLVPLTPKNIANVLNGWSKDQRLRILSELLTNYASRDEMIDIVNSIAKPSLSVIRRTERLKL